MISINDFCKQHNACNPGKEWALENCKDMQEAWETAKPQWLIWIATRQGVLTDKELRLFAVFCARQVQYLMKDERSVNAIDVAERFANGEATEEEMAAARSAAWDAAWDAAAAARAAAARAAAARAAAWAAAWAADGDAALAAAARAAAARDAAARAAAWDAAWNAAAWDAAWDAQSKWLRENCKPCFEEAKNDNHRANV